MRAVNMHQRHPDRPDADVMSAMQALESEITRFKLKYNITYSVGTLR